MPTPFNSDKVIIHKINETELSTFLVGFDIDDNGSRNYRIDDLVKVLTSVLHEFAFGHHEGLQTNITDTLPKIAESAKSIYKIDEFQKAKDLYLNDGTINDDVSKNILRRGEFGELILHLLLRDFHKTIPLLSKIYFKDSLGTTVHGFDAVHIEPATKTLWLGESKIYIDAKGGIRELVKDIKNHFVKDYLNSEFVLISKKIQHFDNIPQKDYWVDLLDDKEKLETQIQQINIPLLCTYTSELFESFNDETDSSFLTAYENEMRNLKSYFDEKNDHPLKTRLNIILVLFPVKDKIELVKKLHHKLSLLQELG